MAEMGIQKEILLVDDDPDYLSLTQKRLEASGYRVICAQNGGEALRRLEEADQPDLIIMDVDMPERNGLATLIQLNIKRMRRRLSRTSSSLGSKVPVIVATGLQGESIRGILMTQEVNDFIQKPYNAQELIEKIKTLIG
jgi:two-component system, OmpR family, response regulator VicR